MMILFCHHNNCYYWPITKTLIHKWHKNIKDNRKTGIAKQLRFPAGNRSYFAMRLYEQFFLPKNRLAHDQKKVARFESFASKRN